MSADSEGKQPTVFILYIPGGAMMGIIPSLVLSRLEMLTETPTQKLFQVVEGVSTGAILAGGFSVPGIDARKGTELFVQHGPSFFPDIPSRWPKMHARSGINIAKFFFDLDPKQRDRLVLRNIEDLCDKMKTKTRRAYHNLVDDLEKEATQRWLTSKDQKRILQMGQTLRGLDPNLGKYIDALAELINTRTYTNRLSIVFKMAAVAAMDGLKNSWAKKEECYFDPKTAQATFQKIFGERKLSEGVCSTYISAYDILSNRVVTFSSLKKDLFNTDERAPATVKNDLKVWDAVMASIANPLAYPPHITENNLLCTDKAPIHKPRSVKDVLSVVPKGTKVVLVVAGTGDYHPKDVLDDKARLRGEEGANLTEEQKHRKKLEMLRDYYVEFGVTGNLALGNEISELEGYAYSDAMDEFAEKLGQDNIIEIRPRLAPRTPREKAEFPSRDVLDASRDNIKKIIRRGRQLIEDEDTQIRRLAQMLVDNQRLLGRMDDEKYARVCARIGLKTFDDNPDIDTLPEAEAKKVVPGIENRIPNNDNSTGLRWIWRQVTRKIADCPLFKPARAAEDPPKDKIPGGPEGPK